MENINDIKYTEINACIVCNYNMQTIIELKNFPLTELYEEFTENFQDKGYLDQELMYCDHCSHASLKKNIDVKFVYSNYLTSSSNSIGAIDCLNNFYHFIINNADIISKKYIIDVGGNDSTLLSKFKKNVKELINIDPNAVKSDGITIEKDFIEKIDFEKYKSLSPKVILSSHTLEHLINPYHIIEKLSNIINHDDLLIIQIPSFEKIISDLRFDQISHQHLHYFSLDSLIITMRKVGMNILKYEYDENHYGTLRIIAVKGSKIKQDKMKNIKGESIQKTYKKFLFFMEAYNSQLDSIDEINGFGAGLMVPILKYFLPNLTKIKKIYDDNPSKHGKRYINMNAEICSSDLMKYDENIIITSIATKLTARKIFKLLIDRKIKNIFFPVMFT